MVSFWLVFLAWRDLKVQPKIPYEKFQQNSFLKEPITILAALR